MRTSGRMPCSTICSRICMAEPYKVVSLFSGGGGSSLGYKLAGFDVAAASESDRMAQETYAANFPGTVLFRGDVRSLTGGEIMETTGLETGELDILDGSPPCTSFSISGARERLWGQETKHAGLKQTMDDLFWEYRRILEELKPRCFVAENVAGMVVGTARIVFDKVFAMLSAAGYSVSCRMLNSMYFGVPQSRNRLIWIGARNDLGIRPSHPKPQTRPISLREALANVMNDENDLVPAMANPKHAVYAMLLKVKEGECGSDHHPDGNWFNLIRPSWDKPCPTVLASHGSSGTAGVYHPEEMRKFTIKELKVICGFPEWFRFAGSYADQWERIGNSVPPPMMAAVASHVKHHVLHKADGIESAYNPAVWVPRTMENQDEFGFASETVSFRNFEPFGVPDAVLDRSLSIAMENVRETGEENESEDSADWTGSGS